MVAMMVNGCHDDVTNLATPSDIYVVICHELQFILVCPCVNTFAPVDLDFSAQSVGFKSDYRCMYSDISDEEDSSSYSDMENGIQLGDLGPDMTVRPPRPSVTGLPVTIPVTLVGGNTAAAAAASITTAASVTTAPTATVPQPIYTTAGPTISLGHFSAPDLGNCAGLAPKTGDFAQGRLLQQGLATGFTPPASTAAPTAPAWSAPHAVPSSSGNWNFENFHEFASGTQPTAPVVPGRPLMQPAPYFQQPMQPAPFQQWAFSHAMMPQYRFPTPQMPPLDFMHPYNHWSPFMPTMVSPIHTCFDNLPCEIISMNWCLSAFGARCFSVHVSCRDSIFRLAIYTLYIPYRNPGGTVVRMCFPFVLHIFWVCILLGFRLSVSVTGGATTAHWCAL